MSKSTIDRLADALTCLLNDWQAYRDIPRRTSDGLQDQAEKALEAYRRERGEGPEAGKSLLFTLYEEVCSYLRVGQATDQAEVACRNAIRDVELELAALREAAVSDHAAAEKAQAKIAQLEDDLETTEGLKSEARGERDESALEAQQWRAAFDRAAAECVDLRVLLAVQRTNCTKALDQKDSFGRENASLKTQVAALEEENQRLLAKGRALAKQVDTARAEAEELNARLMAAGSPLPDLAGNSLASPWRKHPRLARLDAMLASEAVPNGLWDAVAQWPCLDHGRIVTGAWRWFRQTFAGETKPLGDLPVVGTWDGRLHLNAKSQACSLCGGDEAIQLMSGTELVTKPCPQCCPPLPEDVQGEPEGGQP